MIRRRWVLRLWLGMIFVIMAVAAFLPFGTAKLVRGSDQAFNRIGDRVDRLNELMSLMKDAESGQRGFIVTGHEEFLEPYHRALTLLGPLRHQIRADFASDPTLPGKLDPLIDAKLAELARTIAIRRSEGFQAVEPIITGAVGKQYMDQLRKLVDDQVESDHYDLDGLNQELQYRFDLNAAATLAATLLEMALLALMIVLLLRQMRSQQEANESLAQSRSQLAKSFAELERYSSDVALVGEMTNALEAPESVRECFEILAGYCSRLMPEVSGVLYLFRNSRDLLERKAQWGAPVAPLDTLVPQDCWALRRGQMHRALDAHHLVCPHYRDAGAADPHSLCIPLTAHGEVLGLMCIESVAADGGKVEISQRLNTLILTLAEQISVSLANINLREALRHQSIVDPLTGLYNRRYMDETLRREIARSTRKSSPLSLILLDVDHFKRINDTYGHEGGDDVLRQVSHFIRRSMRDSDVACRFGGEELALILPDCDKAAAAAKAEQLSTGIRLLQIVRSGQPIGPVTASFGVAALNEDGFEAGALFQAADRAMYDAKKSGRDRVVLAF